MTSLDGETASLLRRSIKEYTDRHLPEEFILELDRKGEFPRDDLEEMYDREKLGLHLLLIPSEYGGAGAGAGDIYRICEQLARVDLGIATAVFATFLGMDPIREGGTREQKEKWFNKLAKEGNLIAYCATEAEAGSDLGALKTTATPAELDGKRGYRISGSKQWISNGGMADIFLVLAKDTKSVGWFIVEKGAEGITHGLPEDKHGIRAANTASVTFDNVFVPGENLVGMEEGEGLAQAQAVFGFTRVMVAAFGLGGGWEALERAIRYSQHRIQAGGPLSEKQGYTHKFLVPNAVKLEAGRAYIEKTANRLDEGEGGLQTEGAIAKYFCTQAGNEAADDSIQALGGYGYVREYMVEKLKRDVRITTIYEGTHEIMEMTIARNRWQEHLKSRGEYYQGLSREMLMLHMKRGDVGANVSALGLSAMGKIMEECRNQKLTRNQHVLMRLGELISWAEVSYSFCQIASSDPPESVRFKPDVYRAMSRIFSRIAARKIASDGMAIISGYGEDLPRGFDENIDLDGIMRAESGMSDDKEKVKEGLMETFRG